MANFPLETNAQTFMQIDSPFGDDVILSKIQGEEALSSCFYFHVELVSKRNDLSFSQCVGKNVTVFLDGGKSARVFNGTVNMFQQKLTYLAGTNDEYTLYEMTFVPDLWFLTQNVLCRVFEALTYQQIIEEVLKEHKIKVKFDLTPEGKPVRELCIQYNESDFHFINRLMEEEGVYYFFIHEKGAHTLVITDRGESFERVSEEALEYIGPHDTDTQNLGVLEIYLKSESVPSETAVDDFNFKTPRNDLLAQARGGGQGGMIFHYPGNYWQYSQRDGEHIAKLRLEKEQKDAVKLEGKSNVHSLSQGHFFTLIEHPRADLSHAPWVVEKVRHFAELQENLKELQGTDIFKKRPVLYQNTFVAFSRKINYRPPFKTSRPKISTQTAIVIGKRDEEIWTDEYGRIHVRFHWDNNRDYEDSISCWVRVATPWSGNQWGIRFTPRIGQEVVVQFLESNPDHPLVTGCVYNEENLPPYLPDHPTVSTIKTNSSPSGNDVNEGYNEIRFEDKKEEEQVFIHAQRNMDTLVEANQTVTLNEGDRTLTLHAGDEVISLEAGNRTTTVKGGDELHENEQNYTHVIDQNDTKKVGGNLTEEVSGNYAQKIDGNLVQEINGNAAVTVAGDYALQVQGNLNLVVTGTVSLTAAGISLTSSANVDMIAGAAATLTGKSGVTVTSGAALSLSGSASAQLSGSGVCQVTGGTVIING